MPEWSVKKVSFLFFTAKDAEKTVPAFFAETFADFAVKTRKNKLDRVLKTSEISGTSEVSGRIYGLVFILNNS